MKELLLLVGITIIPWIELRGSIPVGVARGYHPLWVLAITVAANCAVILPAFALLDLTYDRWLSRWPFFRAQVSRVRAAGSRYVARYQLLGLALFVAIPLPGTGAYSGTLLAWLLGLRRGAAAGAIAAGVLGAGIVVTLVSTGVIAALRRFF